jgi:Ca2+-binding EF-hand superfamily protein
MPQTPFAASMERMTMRFLVIVAAIAAAVGAPGIAWCATAPSTVPVGKPERDTMAELKFRSLDANRDGYISREEARASTDLDKRFDELDRNRDGRLSPRELQAWRAPNARTTVDTVDAHQGAIADAGDRSYGRLARLRPRNPIDRSVADPGAATFKAFDLNGDGYISREEAKESGELTRRFAALDKNGDGKLSMFEMTGWRRSAYSSAVTPTASTRGGPYGR